MIVEYKINIQNQLHFYILVTNIHEMNKKMLIIALRHDTLRNKPNTKDARALWKKL